MTHQTIPMKVIMKGEYYEKKVLIVEHYLIDLS